jgi:excisionase family DNA binding protein
MSSPSRRAGALPAPMLYSIRETERLLGVSRPTIYRLIAAGRLVALKIGNATGRWRERREFDLTMTLEAKIAAMSPEQRLARLMELQLKAAQVIDAKTVEVEPKD